MPVSHTVKRPNGHDIHPRTGTGDIRCPYCGQPIGRKEFHDIQERIAREERARIAKVEQDLKARFERERAQAEAKVKAQIDKAKKEGGKVAETKLRAIVANQDAIIAARLDQQRKTLDKAKSNAIAVERAKAFEEKAKLTAQLADLQRRIERKTAHELGEPAEVDLFETLRAAFPRDQISRVAKGARGPDVIIEVIDKGTPAGKIVLDSKNHARWSNKFTEKLRDDQKTACADFAILSTTVFPAGQRQLYIKENVIVADPARVAMVVHLVRRQIIENYRLKLGADARDEKAEAVFAFIVSPTAKELLDRVVSLTEGLSDLDRSENAAHQKVWGKRADLIRQVRVAHDEFTGAIDSAVGGAS